MTRERFEVGKMYFMGGYDDPQRTRPRPIRPLIFVGKRPSGSNTEFSIYSFEEAASWFRRAGQGAPDSNVLEEVEGPPDITLVMDLNELIDDLQGLQHRLGR